MRAGRDLGGGRNLGVDYMTGVLERYSVDDFRVPQIRSIGWTSGMIFLVGGEKCLDGGGMDRGNHAEGLCPNGARWPAEEALEHGPRRPDAPAKACKPGDSTERSERGQDDDEKWTRRQVERLAEGHRLRLAVIDQETPVTIEQKAGRRMRKTSGTSTRSAQNHHGQSIPRCSACARDLVKAAADQLLSASGITYDPKNGDDGGRRLAHSTPGLTHCQV